MRPLACAFVLLFIAGCGGAIDTSGTGTNQQNEPGTPSSPPGDLPPVPSRGTPPPPSTSSPDPQVDLPDPKKIADPPNDGMNDAPFHLVVSNLSKPAGTIGMDFSIDGVAVVAGGFVPGVTYNFDFALPKGTHTLVLQAAASMRTIASTEKFVFQTTGEHWGVVKVTTVRCDPCSNAAVKWQLSDTAPPK